MVSLAKISNTLEMKYMWKGLKHCDRRRFWSLEWFWRSKGSKTGES